MAAGATVAPGRLATFREFLAQSLAAEVGAATAETALVIDSALTARGATVDLAEAVETAGQRIFAEAKADRSRRELPELMQHFDRADWPLVKAAVPKVKGSPS